MWRITTKAEGGDSNLVEAINGAFRDIQRQNIVDKIAGIWEWMAKKRHERSSCQIMTSLTPNAFEYLTGLFIGNI
jgi:hypothetical protein